MLESFELILVSLQPCLNIADSVLQTGDIVFGNDQVGRVVRGIVVALQRVGATGITCRSLAVTSVNQR
jgi:hypothetical protein